MEKLRPIKFTGMTKLIDYHLIYGINDGGDIKVLDLTPSVFTCAGCFKDTTVPFYFDPNSYVLHEYRGVTSEIEFVEEGTYYHKTDRVNANGLPIFEVIPRDQYEVGSIIPVPLLESGDYDLDKIIYRRIAIKTQDHQYQFSKKLVNRAHLNDKGEWEGDVLREAYPYYTYDMKAHEFKIMRFMRPVHGGLIPNVEDGYPELVFEDFKIEVIDSKEKGYIPEIICKRKRK